MALPVDPTIQLYASRLNGARIIVIHESRNCGELAALLAAQFQCVGHDNCRHEPATMKELGHAVRKAGYVVLLFSSLEKFSRKLHNKDEVFQEVKRKKAHEMVCISKEGRIPEYSPLRGYMCFSTGEGDRVLAEKCVTIFGAPKPVPTDADAVKWHDQPVRVVLTKRDGTMSLGLSIISRPLHPSLSSLNRATLIKEISEGSLASYHSLLKKYMHIQSINGVSLDNKTIGEAALIIQQTGGSDVQLMVRCAQRDLEKARRTKDRPEQLTNVVPGGAETPLMEEFNLTHYHSSSSNSSNIELNSSGSTPNTPVFNDRSLGNRPEAHRRPSVITGFRKRGDSFSRLKWERRLMEAKLPGGQDGLPFSLTLANFKLCHEGYSHGVIIKEVNGGTDQPLRVNDLLHSIEDIMLVGLSMNEVMQAICLARERNTQVLMKFYQASSCESETAIIKSVRSDEGISEEHPTFVSGDHYHNILVVGSSAHSKEVMRVLRSGAKRSTADDTSVDTDDDDEAVVAASGFLSDAGSLLVQQYLDKDWRLVDRLADPTVPLTSISCEYVVSMIDHEIIDLQLTPMSLLQHTFMKCSQVTILVVDLDSYCDDPYTEFAKMQSVLNIVHAHAHPDATQVIIIGAYDRIGEERAVTVAQIITSMGKRFMSTNNLIVEQNDSLVYLYRTSSSDGRWKARSYLQDLVQRCIGAFYRRLEHTVNYYMLKQWPAIRRDVMVSSQRAPIIPLRSLDHPIKKYCSMEGDGGDLYLNLLETLQEHSPAHFFGKASGKLQSDTLIDPSIIPMVLAQVIPAAVERQKQFVKGTTDLFMTSLVISQSHLRHVLMEARKDLPIDALIEWMVQLLVAFRFTVDTESDAVETPSSRSGAAKTAGNVFIFLPLLGQFTVKPTKQNELRSEFQSSDGVWKVYAQTGVPVSAAFFYEILVVLIKAAFDCYTSSEWVRCFHISSSGQLATVSFHSEASPMHFKLMVEFHELQQTIEFRLRRQENFQHQCFYSFIKQRLQEVCEKPHWRHLKRNLTMGYKPSVTENKFSSVFHALRSLADVEMDFAFPSIYNFEMSLVFDNGRGLISMCNTTKPTSPTEPNMPMDKYTHGKMDYATFKVVSQILDSTGKWDVFADKLKLFGLFELTHMQKRYSMVSQGMEVLSAALVKHTMEDITSVLSQLNLNLAVDIINKRTKPQEFSSAV